MDRAGGPPRGFGPLEFTTDIAPIFAANNCGGCHSAGGNADTAANAQGGFPSVYDGTALEIWTNLTGDGAMVSCSGTDNYRVCINDPEASTVLTNPLQLNSMHLQFWVSMSDPDAATLYQWIQEGAVFTP